MSTEEKQKLIERIAQTDDQVLLSEIGRMLEIAQADHIYELSEDQLDHIKVAQDQIKDGHTLSHQDAMRETEKWLEK